MRRDDTNRLFEVIGGLSAKVDTLTGSVRELGTSTAARLDQHAKQIKDLEQVNAENRAVLEAQETRSKRNRWVFGAAMSVIAFGGPFVRAWVVHHL